MVEEIDSRPMREQLADVMNGFAAQLAALNKKHQSRVQVAFLLAAELFEQKEDGEFGDTNLIYLSNLNDPVEFLAAIAESVEENPPAETRSIS